MKNELKITSVPVPIFEQRIYFIRGYRVMLDMDLAESYEVETKNLNKAVVRNIERFPKDFMFRLTEQEVKNLRFQFGTSSLSHGGRRYLPYAFTEHGVVMLSSVLKSERAVEMGISITRAFIKLREMLSTNKDLAYKLEELERKQKSQGKNLMTLNSILKELMKPVETTPKSDHPMGFNINKIK